MAAVWGAGNLDDLTEIRWTPMLVLSFALHICVFFIILIIPGSIPTRAIKGIVYEVDLVEMPAAAGPQNRTAGRVIEKKEKAIPSDETQAKRIYIPQKDVKPLIVAKRTVKRKSSKIKKPEVSPSQLIDKAISRIEKKVKSDDSNHVEKAIAELEKKAGEGQGAGFAGRGSPEGLPMRIYQMEVEYWIKSNWSYPVAVQDQKKLEAVVILKVQQDGTILKSSFKKRSADPIFDQSVGKAIEKSNPLPPFPEGYRKSYEEFEINFNLKDLEEL